MQQQQHACRPCMHFEIIKTWNTSSQKTSCRTHKCPTATFLATGGLIKLFHKIPWFFHDYSVFFQIPWFFLAWNFFSWFSRFSMISRACGNPVHWGRRLTPPWLHGISSSKYCFMPLLMGDSKTECPCENFKDSCVLYILLKIIKGPRF